MIPVHYRKLFASCICVLLCLLSARICLGASVSIDGRQISIDGNRFLMKGVSYAPTPIGNVADQPPYGDYFTTNYRSLYQRDLPLMRQMGVNCLRVYGWSLTDDHTEFLNMAYNGGQQPIYVIINRWVNPGTDWTSSSAVNAIKTEWQNIATATHNNPAVIGYAIGNELNFANGSNPNFWHALNQIGGAVKAVDNAKLIFSPVGDGNLLPQIQTYNTTLTNFNCWGVQMFRGSNFGGFFPSYASASTKPLLVLEFGIDAFDQRTGQEYTGNASLQATYIQNLWQEILGNSNVVSGGAVFSWADEWWKTAGSSSSHDAGGWSNPAFPDGLVDEEWWGIHRINPGTPNVLQPRASYPMLQNMWFVPAAAPTLSVRLTTTNLQPQITVSGTPGYRYVLLSSSNLSQWTPRQTNFPPFTWNEISAATRTNQFYRARSEP